MKKSVWELFDKHFSVGDDAILIDDEDKFVVGKITRVTKLGCYVQERRNKKPTYSAWLNVRFISHDGFPVRKLEGADGSQLIEALDTTDTQAVIREACAHDICHKCKKLFHSDEVRPPRWREWDGYKRYCRPCHRIVFGDPFMVEGVTAKLYNPGNTDPFFWSGAPGEHFEECLTLEAKDGAHAQVFHLASVYHFEREVCHG